jgi:hypothetical protein
LLSAEIVYSHLPELLIITDSMPGLDVFFTAGIADYHRLYADICFLREFI